MPDGIDVKWVNYKDRSLEITRKTAPKFEEWALLMATFNTMNESGSFWRGDLYNLGEEWYGEDMASSIFDDEKWNLKTWQNNASVCRCVPSSRRRESLSFSHHAEVAYLEPIQFEDPPRATTGELQTYYLEVAVANRLSIRQLRDKIKEDRGGKAPPTAPLYKRLSDTASKVYEWMDETEGDARELLVTAWEALSDAAEMLKDG